MTFRHWVCLLVLAAGGVSPAAAQFEYTPDHPEVEEMVRRGIAYLRSKPTSELGPRVLNALAVCEYTKRYEEYIPFDDPLVQLGVDGAAGFTLDPQGKTMPNETMYAPCLCGILLALVDKQKYRRNLEALLEMIYERQQSGGSWGYATDGDRDYGDTSQTQYCCLAMWVSANAGIQVRPEVAQHALQWLFATQVSNGGWGYRASAGQGGRGGAVGGGAGGVTLSRAAAGSGSVYMLADILQAGDALPRGGKRRSVAGQLPAIITEYVPGTEAEIAADARVQESPFVDGGALRNCTSAANRYFEQNFSPDGDQWRYYYLYGFERYAYFREKLEGAVYEVPDWYDQGVRFLKSRQTVDGSWGDENGENVVPGISTVFAILFLVRSTELLAGEPAQGLLTGGLGFGRGTLSYKNGQIVGEQIVKDVDDFLKAIESGEEPDLALYTDELTKIVVPTDPAQRALHLQKLRLLVTDYEFERRYIAVKILGSVRDLDNVPALIYALTDPADDVVVLAHQGLRFISRKIDSIELPAKPNETNMKLVKQQWIDWYRSVRPDGELYYEEETR